MSQRPSTPSFLRSPGIKTFLTIWFGQTISAIGTNLTGFALGVYIYQLSGSVTLFALNLVAFYVPQIALSPLAGVLADRWDRRWVMILSDTGAGFSTLTIMLLFLTGQLQVWHIYLATLMNSSFNTLQWPTWSAAQTLIVPKEHLGRAGGMVQMGQAIGELLAPAIAGVLVITIGLGGIALIDFATFAAAIGTLLVVRIPRPETSTAGRSGQGPLWQESAFGLRYILARRPLMGLLIYFATMNLVFGMISALFGPLLLDASTPQTYGLISSMLGVGFLGGTLFMSASGGTKRRVIDMLVSGSMLGLFLVLAGVRFSIPLFAAACFGAMAAFPIMTASSQALWQAKVEPDVQGRVFATRRMISWCTMLPGLLLAGPLVDAVFNPLMAETARWQVQRSARR